MENYMGEGKKAPFISVTITCYNYAGYMVKGLEQIKKQAFKDFELVLVDDCSSDNTVALVEEFIKNNHDISVTFIKNTHNVGILEARNILLDAAKGKYIMFCDSDDYMDDDCLEVLAEAAKRTDADRIIAQCRNVDDSGRQVQVQELPEFPSVWIQHLHHGTLYKREVLTNNHIRFGTYYPDDSYINLRFAEYCKSAEFVKKTIYNWVTHENSASSTKIDNSPWQGTKMFNDVLTYSKDIYLRISADEKTYLELAVIKLYCVCIYFSYRDSKLSLLINSYNKMHKAFLTAYPSYKHNRFLVFGVRAPMRKYALIIARMTILLEKMHLMIPALFCYHLLCRVHEFRL